MANNLDLKGNVDIGVSSATRNLTSLQDTLGRVTRAQAEFNEMTAAQARVSATVGANVKRQADGILSLARAYTEVQKAAAIASDTQIKQAQAAAKAAEDSVRRQTAAAKAAQAQNALGLNTTTPLKTAAVPSLSPDIKPYQDYINKIVALDRQAVQAQTAARTNGYTQQFRAATRTDNQIAQAGIASARNEAAARGRFAQESFNQELNARRTVLATMRQDAISAFSNLPAMDLGDIGQLNQLRYQLYDIATAFGVVGAAATGASAYVVKTAADYETAFTTIARTTDQPVNAIGDLTDGLIKMSETVPVSTTSLAGIESLGAQLGVATNDLNKFTETTAKYAAVSGVSNEQVAQSFGAIFNLTGTGAAEFDKLASSINYVGIRSVATDAEILKMTQEISASTTQAGFAADKTVGFAAALASLRIQPEQARGVVLRLFSDIDKAVADNGTDLQAYAKQLGVTSKAAADLWKSDPSEFTNRLVKTLSAADNVNGAIRDLGITQTRETNVLQRLAGNYDTYTSAMNDASNAYSEGTFLAESYAKTQDTLASRLQILRNTLENLAARAGSVLAEALKPIVSLVSGVLSALSQVPAPIYAVIVGFTALLGVFALLVAAGAGALGTMLAIAAAMRGFQSLTGSTTFSFSALAAVIRQLAREMGLGAAANRIMSASLLNVTGSSAGAAAASTARARAVAGEVAAVDTAAVANRTFAASLLGIPFVNILAALSIAVPLVLTFAQAMGDAKNRNSELAQSLLDAGGGVDAFSTALQKDTAAAKGHVDGLRTIKVGLTEAQAAEQAAGQATQARADTINRTLGVTKDADGATQSVTESLKAQTLVIGENGKAWVANALAQQAMEDQNSAIYKFFNDPKQQQIARQYGINIQQAIADGIGTKGGVQAALQAQFAAAEKTGTLGNGATDSAETIKRGAAFEKLKQSLTEAGGSVDGLSDKLRVQQGIQQALGVDVKNTASDIDGQNSSVAGLAETFQATLSANSNYANSLYQLQQSLDQNGSTFNEWSASGIANITALQNTLNAAVTAGAGMGLSAADSMVAALGSIDVSTDQIKSIVSTLAAANPTLFASMNIDDIIAKAQAVQKVLKGAGFTTDMKIGKDVLGAQQARLSSLLSQRDALQSQVNSQRNSANLSGNTGRKAAPKPKAQKAPELKTAAEYAQDLGAAMQEAFSKKFGVQQAMDDITSKVKAMRDRMRDARDQARELRADLQKLASDRRILNIQLKVALDYGDTTRAEAIRAELAQNASDTAGKQKTLADAIADASTALTGNTDAAVKNRGAVIDLLGAYQQQIQAYANTGASAREVTIYANRLRDEFIKQLTQLGYNAKSVRYYAGTFDTLTAAVNRVPTHKDVKVTADTSQAIGGLNSVGSRISGLSGQLSNLNAQIAATQGAIDKQKRANAINKEIGQLQGQISKILATGADNVAQRQVPPLQKRLDALQARLASGNYYRGGVIGGSGGRPTSKFADNTTINAQIGEGVVTLDGMKMLGAAGLNAINNQQNPFPPVIINNSQSNANSGTLVVELSPIDRQLLAQGKNVQVVIGRDQIANAANAANLNTARRGANG